ncbi:NUDIX hydrolase [Actinomadura rubrisoli]|uniref:NUDIX hydrolase n=1 Tax=Actinomadura rubrisoli TaxID=2530368 RepID=A0A4R5CDS0_9ACTN|nr:NUDIX hydrolase [Actinomadura rubrisoli]TDD97675.1 NUDIX hydrolase [Actinomadura rubrisoli]
MGDPCNHAVVGVLAVWEGRYLTGLRAKTPVAVAPCAGHVDELATRIPTGAHEEEPAFRAAGVRELEEETGLRVRDRDLSLVLNRLGGDRCHRKAGSIDGENWHHWLVFTTLFTGPQPPKVRSNGELHDLTWRTPRELADLRNLEPIWREFLRELRII